MISEKLRTAIQEYALDQGATVQDGLKWTRASQNGDSFAADVIRISITVPKKDENENVVDGDPVDTTCELRLIAKVAPKLTFRRDMYSIPVLFEREKFMYTTLLPDFKAFQLKHLPPGQPTFDNYPGLIKSSNEAFEEYLLLHDICEEGYVNFDRTEGVSVDVCKEIFKTFARFHAISFVYQAKDRQGFDALVGDNVRETLFVMEPNESFAGFLSSKVDLVSKKLIEFPKDKLVDERVLERLKVFRRECAMDMYAACNVKDYAVICHGDSWISNFMFKMVSGGAMDVKIIDFQVSRFTTPIVDLAYFMGCSTDKELRKHLPELLLFYFNTLLEEMRRLGQEAPEELYPYEVFVSHCKKYMKFGFGMAMMSLHSITCQPENMPDVITLLETSSFEMMNEYTETLSKNPAYIERITDLVRDMVQMGYL